MEVKCPFCLTVKKSNHSVNAHIPYCVDNPDKIKKASSYQPGGRRAGRSSNQYMKALELGLPKPSITPETRLKLSEISKKNSENYWKVPENRVKHSLAMKKAVRDHPESYSTSPKHRRRDIKIGEISFDSYWEVDFYNYCVKENIEVVRNSTESFEYLWEGQTHLYFPDFYCESLGLYFEIKGYETDRDISKWRDFPHRLVIIKQKEIKEIRIGIFDLCDHIKNF